MTAVIKTCETCGADFSVRPYRKDTARFCSASCKSSMIAAKHFNKGPKPWAAKNLEGHRHKSTSRFTKGNEPWNKGVKGLHLSPDTEFKPGQPNGKELPLGSVTVREDKNGKPRAWIKTADGWMPRAQAVFLAKHKAIPEGHIVHHRDGDSLNDRPGNLVALTPSQHIQEHRADLRAPTVKPTQAAFNV